VRDGEVAATASPTGLVLIAVLDKWWTTLANATESATAAEAVTVPVP
jgi:hypothetical protein